LIDSILLATEAELRQAIFTLLDQEQQVVEASGAIAIAPLLSGQLDVAGRTVACVLTGGNLDTVLLRNILFEMTGDPSEASGQARRPATDDRRPFGSLRAGWATGDNRPLSKDHG
jgi:threonine dehydratase